MKVRLAPFLFLLAMALGIGTSCTQTGKAKYVKQLQDISAQYNKKCPIVNDNGTTLESVTFADSTMLFRLKVTDKSLYRVNTAVVRDSIIHNMSDKLKKYLVRGDCKLEYRYISSRDSTAIIITPKELTDSIS